MTSNFNNQSNLPAISPDLVLVCRESGRWQIQGLSQRLAQWLEVNPSHFIGHSPEAILPQSVPSITTLAAEVLADGRDLSSIKVRLQPEQQDFLADLQFAGLTEDYLGQIVRISLRHETVTNQEEINFHGMIGISPAMREVFRKIRLYAPSSAAVIITGETGTGKELTAKALHDESPRQKQPFAALNCAAISEQLLESELFGHERGAFTGAVKEHRGYFERANGGTLFLDEIGDMPAHTQTKLLRVLEDSKVQRVGGEQTRQVDVRFIGATNVPLEQAVTTKQFRADLYHRLAVLRIHLPALRDRPEDIPLLADVFLHQFNHRYDKKIKRLTSEAIRLLQAYLWPGNIRELRNVLERVVIEAETEAIGARAFTEWIHERQQFANTSSLATTVEQPEAHHNLPVAIPYSPATTTHAYQASVTSKSKNGKIILSETVIRNAYRNANGNLSAAARDLGVHRATLYRHLHHLNLTRNDLI